MNTRLVNNLPFEMKLNILKYYPIVEKRREHINIGIRNIYKIKKLIIVYFNLLSGRRGAGAPLLNRAGSWSFFLCSFLAVGRRDRRD